MKLMKKDEATREQLENLLADYSKAYLMLSQKVGDSWDNEIRCIELSDSSAIQMKNIASVAYILDIPLTAKVREEQDPAYLYEISIVYDGIRFFEICSEDTFKNEISQAPELTVITGGTV